MQSLTTILGATNAARFLQLANSTVRYPFDSLLVLNEDRSTRFDLTPYLMTATVEQSDETNKSEMTSFTLSNPNCFFDEYGAGAGAAYLAVNTLISYRKGFFDTTVGSPTYGQALLIPAAFGRITDTTRDVARSGVSVDFKILDLFKNVVKKKVTTDLYQNQFPNQIATDVAQRYISLLSSYINLASTGTWPAYVSAQFPDMGPMDILQMLYQPLCYFVRMDEGGNLVSGPKLGSALSGYSNLLGYPDQLTAPPDSSVAYVIPDALSVQMVTNKTQDYTFYNQVRALGKDVAAQTNLGPQQRFFTQADSSIDAQGRIQNTFPFSQTSGSQNNVLAKAVIVVFRYSTTHNLDTAPQYMCFSQDGTGHLPPGVPSGTPIYAAGATPPDITNSDPHSVGFVRLVAVTPINLVLDIEGRQYSSGHVSTRHHGGFDYSFEIWGNPLVSYIETLTAFADYNPVNVTNLAMPAYGTTFAAGTTPYGDVFGDHQTYQLPYAPIAKSIPVELSINPSSLPSTTLSAAAAVNDAVINLTSVSGLAPGITFRLGTGATTEYVAIGDQPPAGYTNPVAILGNLTYAHASGEAAVGLTGAVAADETSLSNAFNVDWERGRAVLSTLLYRNFSEDDNASHPLSQTIPNTTGPFGTQFVATSTYDQSSVTFDLTSLDVATPAAVYANKREGDTRYTFTGLVVGQSASLRLHFADDQAATGTGAAAAGLTVFSVYVNGAPVLQDFDIYVAAGGARIAIQQTITGIVADFSGTITVDVTQRDPASGKVLPGSRATDYTDANGHRRGNSQVCGIEVILAQGAGPSPYVVNSGGPAINPTVPVVQFSFGYSPNQQIYGIMTKDLDDPLVQTQAQLKQMAVYELNRSAWQRNQQTIKVSSIPHLQPGDLIKFYVRKLNKDFWGYIPALRRDVKRVSGASKNTESDTDTYTLYLIFARNRM